MLSSHSALTPEEIGNLIMNVLKRTTIWVSARKADILKTKKVPLNPTVMKQTTKWVSAKADILRISSIPPARMMMKQITVLTTT